MFRSPRSAASSQLPGLLLAGWDLLLPAECVGCGAAGRGWCRRCGASLAGPLQLVRRQVGGQRFTGWAAADHVGPAAAAVVAYKDAGYRQLARPLAGALARSLAAAVLSTTGGLTCPVAVVPIPARRAARRARGADTLAELACKAAFHLRSAGLPVDVHSLLAAERASDQVGLSARARAANVVGTFRVRAAVPDGHVVVVVDDVVTTGATAAAALTALRSGSARQPPEIRVAAITAARLGGRGST